MVSNDTWFTWVLKQRLEHGRIISKSIEGVTMLTVGLIKVRASHHSHNVVSHHDLHIVHPSAPMYIIPPQTNKVSPRCALDYYASMHA